MPRHIGIVAVSYEGAALCYQSICGAAARVMGEHAHPEITLHAFPLNEYLAPIAERNWEEVARILLRSVAKVEAAGADFAICPANTAHEAFEHLMPRSPIPLLHIAEVVADAAASHGCTRLGILGTRFLMEGSVYRMSLSSRGVEAVVPDADARERINGIIFEELVRGIFRDATREYLQTVVARLAEAGCDGVVMGCTELPLLLEPADVDVLLLDSTRLLAEAALRHALDDS